MMINELEERQEGLRSRVDKELRFMLHHFEGMLTASERGGNVLSANYSRLSSFVPHLKETIEQINTPLPNMEALEKLEMYLEKTLLPVKRRLESQLMNTAAPNTPLLLAATAEKAQSSSAMSSPSSRSSSSSISDERKRKRAIEDDTLNTTYLAAENELDPRSNTEQQQQQQQEQQHPTDKGQIPILKKAWQDFDLGDDTEAAVLAILCSSDEIDDDERPAVITEASESSDTSLSTMLSSQNKKNINSNERKHTLNTHAPSLSPLVRLVDQHVGASAPALLAAPRKQKAVITQTGAKSSSSSTEDGTDLDPPLPDAAALSRSHSATLAGKPATLALRRRASIQVLPKKVEYHCASCGEMYTSKSSSLYNPWWSLVRQACPKCDEAQFPWIDISAETNQITHHISDDDDDSAGSAMEEDDEVGYTIEGGTQDNRSDQQSLLPQHNINTSQHHDQNNASMENPISQAHFTKTETSPRKGLKAMDTSGDIDDDNEFSGILVAPAEKSAAEQADGAGSRMMDNDDQSFSEDQTLGIAKPELSRGISGQTTNTTDDENIFVEDNTSFAPEPSPLPTPSVDDDDDEDEGQPWPLGRASASMKRRLEGTDAWRLSQSQASALLELFHHARHCPGKHESRKHADVCLAAKYVMLHVRDCQGTLPCGESCPFPWCKALKQFLRHVLQCVDDEDCAVCAAEAHRVITTHNASCCHQNNASDNAVNEASPSDEKQRKSHTILNGQAAPAFSETAPLDHFVVSNDEPIPPLVHHAKPTLPKKARRKKNHTRPSFDYWETLDRQHASEFFDAHIVG